MNQSNKRAGLERLKTCPCEVKQYQNDYWRRLEMDITIGVLASGSKMTEAQFRELIFGDSSADEEMRKRLCFIGYIQTHAEVPDGRRRMEESIIWLIKHFPQLALLRDPVMRIAKSDSSSNYQAATELWDKHIIANPRTIPIIVNAAYQALLFDLPRAQRLLAQAQRIDEQDAEVLKLEKSVREFADVKQRFKDDFKSSFGI